MSTQKAEVKLSRDLKVSELIDISEKLSRYMSDVSIKNGGKQGNMKSVMSLMALNVKKDDTVTIEAVGDDCSESLKLVLDMIGEN